MANITTNTLKIGDNNLVLRDADAQAKLAANTQKIATLEADISTLKEDIGVEVYVDGTSLIINTAIPDGNEVSF